MKKTGFVFMFINLLLAISCNSQTVKLQGKWLAELTNGHFFLLDINKNEELTLGYIHNSIGPLQLETERGKWKFENGTLELSLPDENQELKVESISLDSVIFKTNKSNKLQLKKLVSIVGANQSSFFNLEKKLIGKRMIDSNRNTYHFLNNKQFIYTNSENAKPQEKNWYVFEFEGIKLLILGDGEWFAMKIVFIPSKILDEGISFKFFYKNHIDDFVLSNLESTID